VRRKQIKEILVFRNDRFGEFLLNIPAIRALKQTFCAWITIVVDGYVKELAKCIPYVDEVLVWSRDTHRISEILRFAWDLRRKAFDLSVVLNPTKEAHIITYLAGIPLRVGYNRKWGFLLTHKIEDKKHLAEKHEVEYNLELVSLVGASTNNLSLEIKIPEEAFNWFSKIRERHGLGEKYVVLHPFTSDPYKQWPLENFYSLLEWLKGRTKTVIIGGKYELEKVSHFSPLVDGGKVINLVGGTDLVKLACLLKNAKFLISNDSGPVHLACSVGTKCVVLFNDSIPYKSSKRWGPWGEGHIVISSKRLEEIKPEDVIERLEALI
jgi:heptosyltransferase-2